MSWHRLFCRCCHVDAVELTLPLLCCHSGVAVMLLSCCNCQCHIVDWWWIWNLVLTPLLDDLVTWSTGRISINCWSREGARVVGQIIIQSQSLFCKNVMMYCLDRISLELQPTFCVGAAFDRRHLRRIKLPPTTTKAAHTSIEENHLRLQLKLLPHPKIKASSNDGPKPPPAPTNEAAYKYI